ncbi:3'(2'),5'-bisphosphate nucleotidase [Solemya pervernicosa gill symbiont]|uniref:3'(2'),5'-bisphosphate nucleotidase CysQ n=2 Tax=Gammaproteobacteria incertae sedis TaxID=118884 RepID=A0A1T2L2A7_9GAMM|nr:3'(2'),5'-bisphosphate nucleotidase CysQ [Candidatus Reidiella endopervernicosa]OOZ39160.1 3'(2'),5'-bisphosphate nucleotidase [Solemya pervernicosa gill symbiont]QKQ28014.1 3'(2'),5'-bisphosphate nucleotidase CysQ [Candidatus Reidiella endopervernicosa]
MSESNTPCPLDLEALIGPVAELSREAGRLIIEIYNTEFSVELKEDQSPLTQADMAAHGAIKAGLAALTPEIPLLSEEEANIPFSERSQWSTYWLVDPLDGTREFIKRNGEFTVNIALIHNHRSVLGSIHVPVSGVDYFAWEGGGSFKQIPGGEPEQIKVASHNDGPLRVAGSRSHRGDSLNAFLERIGEYEIIGMGSSLKSCLVAEGRAHLYPRLGPTSEWDTAAAQCVVEEAGGQLTETDMQPLRYNTKDSLLNPHFFVYGEQHDWSQYLDNA